MIGSEGTLAFISHIVYRTVDAPPFKATALMMFPQIEEACQTAHRMQALPVAAAELMDRASLRSVEGKGGYAGHDSRRLPHHHRPAGGNPGR
jgi:D-lactate dehydrogenase